MEETITLADGTVYLQSRVMPSRDRIYLHIFDDTATLHDVFMALEDPDNTASISAVLYGETTEYNGYTELIAISKEQGINQITATLAIPQQ